MLLPSWRTRVLSGSTVVTALLAVLLPGLWPLIPGAALFGFGWAVRKAGVDADEVELAAYCWSIVAVSMALLGGLLWPAPPAVGLLAAGVWLSVGGRRPHVDWIDSSVDDRTSRLLALALTPATAVALIIFIETGQTDIDAATEGLKDQPVWLLVLAGVAYVTVNPIVEEVLFRGLLQTSVTSASGRPLAGILTQGLAFGTIHWSGIPGGLLGMAMAGTWGIALGVVRQRTGSIRIPWAVHVVANVVIFVSVVVVGAREGVL